jgi:hypothetical protein
MTTYDFAPLFRNWERSSGVTERCGFEFGAHSWLEPKMENRLKFASKVKRECAKT